jgi:hypothetical protein
MRKIYDENFKTCKELYTKLTSQLPPKDDKSMEAHKKRDKINYKREKIIEKIGKLNQRYVAISEILNESKLVFAPDGLPAAHQNLSSVTAKPETASVPPVIGETYASSNEVKMRTYRLFREDREIPDKTPRNVSTPVDRLEIYYIPVPYPYRHRAPHHNRRHKIPNHRKK